jgi:hypothetical protein
LRFLRIEHDRSWRWFADATNYLREPSGEIKPVMGLLMGLFALLMGLFGGFFRKRAYSSVATFLATTLFLLGF